MSQETPERAQRLEDWGKEVEDFFNKWSDDQKKKYKKECSTKSKVKPPKWERKGEFAGEIFGNLIALFVVNMAPTWFPGFFTSAYQSVLWVMNVVLVITLVGNFILLLFSPKFLYHLLQSLMHGLSVMSMITIITIFPFNGFYGFEILVKFGLAIATFIIAIIAIVHFFLGLVALISNR